MTLHRPRHQCEFGHGGNIAARANSEGDRRRGGGMAGTSARRAAVALLVCVLVALSAGTPAHAADPDPAVELDIPADYYLNEPGVGPTGGTRLWLEPRPAPGHDELRDVTLTVDATELMGIARFRSRGDCGRHATGKTYTFTCTLGTLSSGSGGSGGGRGKYLDALYVEAKPGARTGAHGTLRYTFAARGVPDTTVRTEVHVAGPELVARKHPPREDLKAGSTLRLTPQIRNAGTYPAKGFGMTLQTQRTDLAAQYSNCRYAARGGSTAYCVFDTTLKPGQAYELSQPFSLTTHQTLIHGAVSYHLSLPGVAWEWNDTPGTDPEELPREGKGAALTVRPVDRPADAFSRARGGSLALTTDLETDLRLRTEPIRGKVGETAEVELAVHNVGPGQPKNARLKVTPPEGVTVVPPELDPEGEDVWECTPWRGEKETLSCRPNGTLGPGKDATLTLTFRIDKRVRGAEGRVEIVDDPKYPPNDPDRSDNAAPLEVRAQGGTPVEPDETPAEEDQPSSGPPSGDGARSGIVVAVALAVILAAVAALVVARRRNN